MILNICLSLTIVVLPLSIASPSVSHSFIQSASDEKPRNYAAEVNSLMDRILSRGETHIGDVVANTWIPPSEDDLNKIRAIGPNAIPVLDHALDSKAPFRQFLAVRLLGTVGGADIVAPLQRVLQLNAPNSVRMAALAALRSAPDSMAVPIIKQHIKDQDPLVAKRARDLLVDYYKITIAND